MFLLVCTWTNSWANTPGAGDLGRHSIHYGVIVMKIYYHDDVIKWKHFLHYWPFVRGIHQSPVDSPHKGQWRGALMFPLICVCINGWVNNREAGYLRCHRAHYDVIVMQCEGYYIINPPTRCFLNRIESMMAGWSYGIIIIPMMANLIHCPNGKPKYSY